MENEEINNCFLSVEQVAHLLGLRPRFIKELLKKGVLGYCKVGSFYRVPMEELTHYLERAYTGRDYSTVAKSLEGRKDGKDIRREGPPQRDKRESS